MVRSAPRACCSTLNRLDEARAHAELAIASAPSQAHQALALIEVARKHDAEALRQAELAAKAEPGLPMPAFIRGTIAYNDAAIRRGARGAARSARRATRSDRRSRAICTS